jgi:Arc/MetJ-type ribon-helix-helix transcriptional regulator
MSEVVEAALRLLFRSRRRAARLPALPVMKGVGTMVDVADRDALYQPMEGR